MFMLETATDEWLFDVLSDFCQIALHALLVLRVNDGDELFHLRADLFHLVFGVGVEQDFAQQGVVLAQHTLGDLHVPLEGGARSILVFHHGSKGEGGDERDGQRVCHRLVVLIKRVFKDVQTQA